MSATDPTVTAPFAEPARAAISTGERLRLGPVSGAGLGVLVLWFSVLVLLPLAAVVSKASGLGWSGFVDEITRSESLDAVRLTLLISLGVAAVNAVMGTLIAWVLVRDEFVGKRVVELLIDVPFALPTIVAGLVLLTLYGNDSPLGISLVSTRRGVVVALLFVTLPFVVRTVQPVLLSLETDVEEAAASLGAGSLTVFRRIVLPALLPAILSGMALAFGRAMGEYGSVVLISGQLPRTEVASQLIYTRIQDDSLDGAAAVATLLLMISVAVLASLAYLQHRAVRRG